MKKLTRKFNQICAQKYLPLGFIRSKSTFARISKDVIQAFSLKYYRDAPVCTVEFGIFPLCLPQPIYLEAGGYGLSEFIVDQHIGGCGWIFDRNSDESINNCIESLSNAIDLYLLPFFETCRDCESALLGCMKLEEVLDRNRRKRLQLIGEADLAVPWQERSLFDYRKFYMALKSRNLSYACQYMNHKVNYCKATLETLDKPNSPKQPDGVRERFLAKLTMASEQLKWLETGDFGKFDDLLNTNESQMREFLASWAQGTVLLSPKENPIQRPIE